MTAKKQFTESGGVPEWRATNDRYLTVNQVPFARVVETLDLTGLTVLDMGCGTGLLTESILARNPAKVIAWDLDTSGMPERLKTHPKVELRQKDFTTEDYSFLLKTPYAIVSNPPYVQFPFIRGLIEAIPPAGVLVITSDLGVRNYPKYEVMARLWGEDFCPVPRGDHYVLLGGFEGRRQGMPDIPARNRAEGASFAYLAQPEAVIAPIISALGMPAKHAPKPP